MKKSFTGPFWLLLVFGLLQLLMISSLLHQIYGNGLYASERPLLPMPGVFSFLMWPMILLTEALVYWLIRRRNRFRALSWTHSVIFVLAFLLNIFFTLIQNMHYGHSSVEGRVNRQIMMYQERYLFFGLVILAHLAFVAVLANCLRKTEPVPDGEGQGQGNLLDDVVL
jgi:hypothetical protein